MVSIRETLNYHKMDRRLYETVLKMGRLPALARNIVALWMWLELMGIDVIHYIKDISDPSLLLNFIKEAETILNIIRQASPLPLGNDELVSLPFMAGFATEPINLRFFYCHSDVVVRGLTYMLDGVGTLIFNDHLFHMLNVYERALSVAHQQGTRPPVIPEELASKYNSRVTTSPEDYRALFVTFSKRCTLTREEIAQYFNERMGQCVERVMLERTAMGVSPMYGRIVFVSEALNEILLSGERTVKFMINGNEVWGRKYIPRIRRA